MSMNSKLFVSKIVDLATCKIERETKQKDINFEND